MSFETDRSRRGPDTPGEVPRPGGGPWDQPVQPAIPESPVTPVGSRAMPWEVRGAGEPVDPNDIPPDTEVKRAGHNGRHDHNNNGNNGNHGAGAEAKADAGSDGKPGSNTDAKADAGPGAKADAGAGENADSKADAGADAKAGTNANAAGPEPDSAGNPQPGAADDSAGAKGSGTPPPNNPNGDAWNDKGSWRAGADADDAEGSTGQTADGNTDKAEPDDGTETNEARSTGTPYEKIDWAKMSAQMADMFAKAVSDMLDKIIEETIRAIAAAAAAEGKPDAIKAQEEAAAAAKAAEKAAAEAKTAEAAAAAKAAAEAAVKAAADQASESDAAATASEAPAAADAEAATSSPSAEAATSAMADAAAEASAEAPATAGVAGEHTIPLPVEALLAAVGIQTPEAAAEAAAAAADATAAANTVAQQFPLTPEDVTRPAADQAGSDATPAAQTPVLPPPADLVAPVPPQQSAEQTGTPESQTATTVDASGNTVTTPGVMATGPQPTPDQAGEAPDSASATNSEPSGSTSETTPQSEGTVASADGKHVFELKETPDGELVGTFYTRDEQGNLQKSEEVRLPRGGAVDKRTLVAATLARVQAGLSDYNTAVGYPADGAPADGHSDQPARPQGRTADTVMRTDGASLDATGTAAPDDVPVSRTAAGTARLLVDTQITNPTAGMGGSPASGPGASPSSSSSGSQRPQQQQAPQPPEPQEYVQQGGDQTTSPDTRADTAAAAAAERSPETSAEPAPEAPIPGPIRPIPMPAQTVRGGEPDRNLKRDVPLALLKAVFGEQRGEIKPAPGGGFVVNINGHDITVPGPKVLAVTQAHLRYLALRGN